MSSMLNNLAKAAQDTAASATQTIQDGANYVSKTLGANTAEAKAEANKEAVKSDQTTLGQKLDNAGDYLSNKADQHAKRAEAEGYNQKLQSNN